MWRFIMSTYHFIGIKGTGMSALAQILHDSGEKVQGSDVEKHFFTQEVLEKKRIPMFPFSETNIKEGQIIIAGNAFNEKHPEIVRARELGLPFYKYHEYLGKLADEYTSRSEERRVGKECKSRWSPQDEKKK